MQRRPSVLVLDVNETISDMSPLAARFDEIGLGAQRMTTWFSNTIRDGVALAAAGGYADFEAVAKSALVSLLSGEEGATKGMDEAVQRVLGTMKELMPHADVAPGLKQLRSVGMRVVTLTNGSRQNTSQLLERGEMSDLVEQNFAVEDVGRWKPAPEPYRYAAVHCEIERAEAMLVAVHPWDINGAKAAGLQAAWINRRGLPYPDVFRAPDLECADFVALAQALVR